MPTRGFTPNADAFETDTDADTDIVMWWLNPSRVVAAVLLFIYQHQHSPFIQNIRYNAWKELSLTYSLRPVKNVVFYFLTFFIICFI